ncbi:TetR/AcrR family transcriptional regulator [Pigmentiphaga humi]|nr:TetR/AcrR family transcriptional regulator [Pigmentiphaga humi]
MTTRKSETGEARWDGRKVGRDSRRDAILSSVGSVLSNGRLSSLTMQDIAAELGITKGNLYYYFTDKQDIIYQCHMRAMEASMLALARAQQSAERPGPRLRQLLSEHVSGILKDGLGSVLLTDLESLHPDQRKSYVALRDTFERGVRAIIEEGVAAGDFHCSDTRLAGFVLLGAINWIPKWFRPEGALSADSIAQGVSELLMGTLCCPPGARPAAQPAPGADAAAPQKSVPKRAARKVAARKTPARRTTAAKT